MPDALPYLTADEFKARLINGGGAGARTAAELPDARLAVHAAQAEAADIGRLHHFTLAPPQTPGVPTLLLDIIAGYATYTATLEWNKSQPLEDRDPVVLGYTYAREQLAELRAGTLVLDGVDVADTGNPDATGGSPESYQPPAPYLGLAEGLTDTPYGYAGGYSFGRDWSHGQ